MILKIIDTFGEEGDLSIEELSEASGVSRASFSRFVKKIGFQNYTDFRIRLASMLELVHTIRKSKFANFDAYDIDPIIQNITATKASMDEEKISLIIHRMRSYKKCFMIGSVDDLATFSPFRKELCSCRIPCYLFYDLHTQFQLLETVEKDTCVLLPTEYFMSRARAITACSITTFKPGYFRKMSGWRRSVFFDMRSLSFDENNYVIC